MSYKIIILTLVISFVFGNDINSGKNSDTRLTGAGLGYDYLEFKLRYPALKITYEEGRRTNDQKYLIPDCMIANDNKKIVYEGTSTIIESGKTFVGITSKSFSNSITISSGIPLANLSFSGSFSDENKNIRAQQETYKSVAVRTQYIDNRYTIMANSRCQLDDLFSAAVVEIAEYLENNEIDLATYHTQKLIKEFGTHYLTKVDIGATMFEEDYLTTTYYQSMKYQSEVIKKSAGFNLFEKILFNAGVQSTISVGQAQIELYNTNTKFTKVDVEGGVYSPGMSVTSWTETLENNLVVIDREGEFISNLINSKNFPLLMPTTITEIRKLIDRNINAYLSVNSKIGCMNRESQNYDPTANVHSDSTCVAVSDNIEPFGGIYGHIRVGGQWCNLNNPYFFFYNNNECPHSYDENDVVNLDDIIIRQCKWTSEASDVFGMLFGGIYTSNSNNLVTNSKSCPPTFQEKTFFDCQFSYITTDTKYATICTSRDFTESEPYAALFGGFVSNCGSFNPWSNSSTECPIGFQKSFAFMTLGACEVYYCAKFKKQSIETNLIPLPLMERPSESNRVTQQPTINGSVCQQLNLSFIIFSIFFFNLKGYLV